MSAEEQRSQFRALSAELKSASEPGDWRKRWLAVPDSGSAQIGWLAPIYPANLSDAKLVSSFVRWRQQHESAYLTRFPVSNESTVNWIRSAVLESTERLMFLVLDVAGAPIGRMGLLDTGETKFQLQVDNVLRGEPSTPGLFGAALGAMENWAARQFGVPDIELEVLESNGRAVAFYERRGYEVTARTEMVWELDGPIKKLQVGSPADEVVLTMRKSLESS